MDLDGESRDFLPTTHANKKQSTWPRTIVMYRGNRPARSHPTGIELLVRFVASVANAYQIYCQWVELDLAGLELLT